MFQTTNQLNMHFPGFLGMAAVAKRYLIKQTHFNPIGKNTGLEPLAGNWFELAGLIGIMSPAGMLILTQGY